MIDLGKLVDKIDTLARERGWSYPQMFDAFVRVGMEKYEVDVENQIITYLGHGESAMKQPEGDFSKLVVTKNLNAANVKKAIKKQQKDNDYARFLREIAAAGITRYVVEMESRTIRYIAKDGKEYVEDVPAGS
jgi:uncharacterized protein YbcV (DUF1398 family)